MIIQSVIASFLSLDKYFLASSCVSRPIISGLIAILLTATGKLEYLKFLVIMELIYLTYIPVGKRIQRDGVVMGFLAVFLLNRFPHKALWVALMSVLFSRIVGPRMFLWEKLNFLFFKKDILSPLLSLAGMFAINLIYYATYIELSCFVLNFLPSIDRYLPAFLQWLTVMAGALFVNSYPRLAVISAMLAGALAAIFIP